MRQIGLPSGIGSLSGADFGAVRTNGNYLDAKDGDVRAAANLVTDIFGYSCPKAFIRDAYYLPVVSISKIGQRHNAIPAALAAYLSLWNGGWVATGVFQANLACHTGADPMERMISRAVFCGHIQPGEKYVPVDDVATMGGTLADLSNFIRQNGGEVVGISLLANSSRDGIVSNAGDAKIYKLLKEREDGAFGHAIEQEFDVSIEALTRDEARYLIGFRDVAELRNRAAAARASRVSLLPKCGVRAADTLRRSLHLRQGDFVDVAK